MRITSAPDNQAHKPLAFYRHGAVVGKVVYYFARQIASDYVTVVPPEARRSQDSRTGSAGFLDPAALVSIDAVAVLP